MWFSKPNVEKMAASRNVRGLVKALRYRDDGVRCAAAEALGRARDVSAVEPLCAVVEGRSVRGVMAWRRGATDEASCASALGHFISRPRIAAISALGKIGSARAVRSLCGVLEEYRPLEESCRRSLEPYRRSLAGRKENYTALGQALRVLSLEARTSAAAALGEIGDAGAKRSLSGLLNDEEESVRKAAAEALERIAARSKLLEESCQMADDEDTTNLFEEGDYRQQAVARILGSFGNMVDSVSDAAREASREAKLSTEQADELRRHAEDLKGRLESSARRAGYRGNAGTHPSPNGARHVGSKPNVRSERVQVMQGEGGEARYEIHAGDSRSDALAFLREVEVKEERRYVVVETPEGNLGKDLVMIFDEKSGDFIEFGQRAPLPKLRKSMTQCARCGYTVLPAGRTPLPSGASIGSVVQIIDTGDMKQKGVGFHCRRCRTLWCPFCAALQGSDAICGICGESMGLFEER